MLRRNTTNFISSSSRIFLCSSSSSSGSNNNNKDDQEQQATATKSGRAPLPPIQSSIKNLKQPDIAGLSASSIHALQLGQKDRRAFSLREQDLSELTRVQFPQDPSEIVEEGTQPRTRPYSEFTGESVAKPSDVAAGTAPFKDKGSVMRPSSIPSSPRPEWMANTERKWVTAPIEFGKSTVDTRREWFRVMHYNTLVDRYHVPDPVSINGRRFTNVDLWDQHVLKIAEDSVKKHMELAGKKDGDTGLLGESTKKQNKDDENNAVAKTAEEETQLALELDHHKSIIEKHEDIKRREAGSTFAHTTNDGFMKRKVWEKKIKKGESKPRGDPRPDAPWQTTPIANVEITDDEEARWHNRGARIAEEIVFYDPDILTVNELNKTHFSNSMWRALRSQGFGALYVSARSDEGRRRVLRNPDKPVPYYGDIGNCVFYHKSRFFPMYQPGADTNTSIPYLHLTGLRDRVTNLCVFLGVLQFTAGDDLAAVRARENEARGVLKALHGLTVESDERMTNGVLLCGDLNNVYADEPCVNILRDRYRSAYDVVGGARWTSWFKRADNKNLPFGSMRHKEPSYEARHNDPRAVEGKDKKLEIADIMKKRATTGTRVTAAPKKEESSENAAAVGGGNQKEISSQQQQEENNKTEKEQQKSQMIKINANEEEPRSKLFDQLVLNPVDIDFPDQIDDISLRAREKLGVVKTTSDYVMYEDRTFSVLRVLDCPSDEAVLPPLSIEEEQEVIDAVEKEFKENLEKLKKEDKLTPQKESQLLKQKKFAEAEARHLAREFWRPGVELLPNENFPSHHIPLLADVCWNRWSFEENHAGLDNNSWNTKY